VLLGKPGGHGLDADDLALHAHLVLLTLLQLLPILHALLPHHATLPLLHLLLHACYALLRTFQALHHALNALLFLNVMILPTGYSATVRCHW
jgi:hypothetical protein